MSGKKTFTAHQWEPVIALETFGIAAELDKPFILVRNQLDREVGQHEELVASTLRYTWVALLATDN